MANEHERATRSAVRTSRDLARIFARLGTSTHPRGRVLSAYRVARKALKNSLDDPSAVEDALLVLEDAVRAAVDEQIKASMNVGLSQAERDLKVYGLPAPVGSGNLSASVPNSVEIVMAPVKAQTLAVRGAVASEMPGAEELILGGEDRMGLLTPGTVLKGAAVEVAKTVAQSWLFGVSGPTEVVEEAGVFQKQAIAAIDGRTTETCLRVHGQIVPLDGLFQLEGVPRYADAMGGPPFHWWCRTATALYRADMDLGLTEQMIGEGTGLLRERFEETGKHGPTEKGPRMLPKKKSKAKT